MKGDRPRGAQKDKNTAHKSSQKIKTEPRVVEDVEMQQRTRGRIAPLKIQNVTTANKKVILPRNVDQLVASLKILQTMKTKKMSPFLERWLLRWTVLNMIQLNVYNEICSKCVFVYFHRCISIRNRFAFAL